ncbi:MAG: NAD-dependent epimerase/dehydratase family protein [Candidatus Sumerlaeia bacterium]|nr:NAD-dependent epimerase/dehydratase family protein [Candidatus Sumerlaeia bacterium]
MKVLITGGAGFIGSHLAAAWTARGADVVVLDSLRSGNRENLVGINCEFVAGLVEDADLVARLARDAAVIHHLAAVVSVPESVENPEETEAINTRGTINVLEAARRGAVRRVVLSSSSAVYGEADRPIHREADLPEPMSPYAISKLSGEHYLAAYSKLYGLETVSLRYFNVYGPRQDPNSPYAAAIAIFSRNAREGTPLKIFGDGSQTRDFVFVEDVVAANLLAAEKGAGVYNVSTGEIITINDLAEKIRECAGSSSPIEHLPPRPGDIMHSRGDATRLRALGWKPTVTLEAGLKRTIGGE